MGEGVDGEVVPLWMNGSNPAFLSLLGQKELPIGESNPGRERDRLECYQLHQPGLSSVSGWSAAAKWCPYRDSSPGRHGHNVES